MHNAEKPNPPASVRDTGGQGGLSASSNTRARNRLRAVAPHSAPSQGSAKRRGLETLAEGNKFATTAVGIKGRSRPTLQHCQGEESGEPFGHPGSAGASPGQSSLADHHHDERAGHVPAAGAFGRRLGGGGRDGSGGREVEAMRPGVQ